MTTVVTKAAGAVARPVGVLYTEPDLQVLDAGSDTALAETGLEPAFTADLLSACLAHERCDNPVSELQAANRTGAL